MTALRRCLIPALVGIVGLVAPAWPQEPNAAPVRAFDPARDDPAVLAGLAAEASAAGELRGFRAWLDSLRVAGTAGRHALAYWGALSLQLGFDPDSVAAAYELFLTAAPDPEVRAALAGVLEANAAIAEAEALRRKAAPRDSADHAADFPSDPGDGIPLEIEEARRTGDPEAVRRALTGVLAAGFPPGRIAVLRGDLHLALGTPDSAVGAWAAAVGAAPRPEALEALGRVRLVRSLQRAGLGADFLTALGRTLLLAPDDPASASGLDSLAMVARSAGAPDSTATARALLAGLAAERVGEAGEPARASRALEAAAQGAGPESASLLLAAGRWARAAGEEKRAQALWREVVERHPGTPDDLEARRLLSAPRGAR